MKTFKNTLISIAVLSLALSFGSAFADNQLNNLDEQTRAALEEQMTTQKADPKSAQSAAHREAQAAAIGVVTTKTPGKKSPAHKVNAKKPVLTPKKD